MVEVKYVGYLRELVGRESETFSAPDLTSRKIIKQIVDKYSASAGSLLLTNKGEVSASLAILHEGRKVDADEVLADGTVIILILPVAGG